MNKIFNFKFRETKSSSINEDNQDNGIDSSSPESFDNGVFENENEKTMLINEPLTNTVEDEGQKQISSSRMSLNKFKDQITQRAKTVMTKTPSLTSILTTPPSTPTVRDPAVYWTEICIEQGKDLAIKDLNGSSDPYVKVYYGTEEKYVSNIVAKSLNPTWNEKFTLFTDDLNIPIYFYLFDRDRIGRDETMGTAKLDLWRLPIDRLYSATLELEDEKRNDGKVGTLKITIIITPKTVEFRDEVKLKKIFVLFYFINQGSSYFGQTSSVER
jgi:Ca2+-dependent lipid-binding protein